MTELRAIIGLGNPGSQYRLTRHNCGFRLVDALARQCNTELKLNARLQSKLVRVQIEGVSVWLVQPITYMNRSGEAFARVAHYYKIDPSAIIVVHDELDLPVGTIKLKQGGGTGGHNGLTDIVSRAGTKDFLRIRIGIGKPAHRSKTVPYVLSLPSVQDMTLIDDAIEDAIRSIPQIIAGQTEQVMNILHSREIPKRDSQRPSSNR